MDFARTFCSSPAWRVLTHFFLYRSPAVSSLHRTTRSSYTLRVSLILPRTGPHSFHTSSLENHETTMTPQRLPTITLAILTLLTVVESFQFHPLQDPNVMKPFSVKDDVKKVIDEVSKGSDTPLASKTLTDIHKVTTTIVKPLDSRHAMDRKKWGVDKDYSNEYWLDKRIHTLGNVGFGGAFHAAVAPLSTKLIDLAAYDGKDIRQEVAEELRKRVSKTNARILDLCCGVGISTRSLKKAFPHAETVIGIDSSPEMVSMASFLSKHLDYFQPLYEKWTGLSPNAARAMPTLVKAASKSISVPLDAARAYFMQGNAEDTQLQTKSFDIVTIMYAFHEAPEAGRQRMLQEARRLLAPGGTLAIVDISHDYVPSESMLAGEPYILEYQQNIHSQLQRLRGFCHQSPSYKTLVPGRAGVWLLKRSTSAFA
ncbi:hypothetical protein MPSEU_000396300 [Mayamaea pseudoterrestris]|nr:hypothetical protein MPSEU_000396300 [Mayamaea pseudoterrestris]